MFLNSEAFCGPQSIKNISNWIIDLYQRFSDYVPVRLPLNVKSKRVQVPYKSPEEIALTELSFQTKSNCSSIPIFPL